MHVMLDIETLGVMPGARILEVAGAVFDPWSGVVGERFAVEVVEHEGGNVRRKIDAATVAWWTERVLEGCRMPGEGKGAVKLEVALKLVEVFFKRQGPAAELRVWSWGIDFDLVILREAVAQCGTGLAWPFTLQRDARTLALAAGVRKAKATHAALADVMDEIAAVHEAVVKLGIGKDGGL